MKKDAYDTVSEAINDLQRQGYTVDFSILAEKDCLYCGRSGLELPPDEFEIDKFYRFEGDTDPGDSMIVYAISSKRHGVKGLVVNAFGAYADAESSAIVRKLHAH